MILGIARYQPSKHEKVVRGSRSVGGSIQIWFKKVHSVGDDAVGSQSQQVLHGPVIVDGVAQAAHACAVDLSHSGRVPQGVVGHHGHAAELFGFLKPVPPQRVDQQAAR